MSNKQKKELEQSSLLKLSRELRHGGCIGKGRRKGARPLERRKLIHLVMRSKKARGKYSLKGLQREQQIHSLVYQQATRYGVRIASFANVGNHLHILLRFQSRHLFQNWLKLITGKIARLVTQARKGQAFGRFWDGLAFTRLIKSRTDGERVLSYVMANSFEGEFNKWVRDLFLWQANHQRELKRQRYKQNSPSSQTPHDPFQLQLPLIV